MWKKEYGENFLGSSFADEWKKNDKKCDIIKE
jgi:hypothetical protein